MAPQQKIKVWDPFIRFFHWTMASAFLLNFTLFEEGEKLHEWAGYYVLALLLIRLLWGFIGPRNARFTDFWPTRRRLRRHFQALWRGEPHDPDRHNPAGGLMIIAMLLNMLLTAVSGWLTTTDMFWGVDWVESGHELFANLTLSLVVVHVAAVCLFSWRGPHNLIHIMLTGYRSR